MKILVTYASTYNATAEIAHLVAMVIRRTLDCPVDVRRMESVRDLAPYDAVVLGSAALLGQWQTVALRFIDKHQDALAERDVWVYSSGPPTTGETAPYPKSGWYPEAAKPILEHIKPHHAALFLSRPGPAVLGIFDHKVVAAGGIPQEELRDWNVIKAWAESIAYHLKWYSISDPDKAIPAL